MIPYYKVISDKSDITLAARNISERKFGLKEILEDFMEKQII